MRIRSLAARAALCLAAAAPVALGLAGTAPAAQPLPPEVAVTRTLISDSLLFVNDNEIDMAVGYATAALDIARHTGQDAISRDIRALLHAYRTLGLAQTAQAAQDQGDTEAAKRLGVVACKMARTAPEGVAGIVGEIEERYCTRV